MSAIDVERVRRETPGCARVKHFNNAGASLMPAPVLQAVQAHLEAEAYGGGYEAADAAAPRLERIYGAVATLLNAHRDEVALTESATRSWDLLFRSLPFRPGDEIVTAEAEYASNFIAYLQTARRSGVRIRVAPSDASGAVSVEGLAKEMSAKTRLIALTHVPTNGGLVNPVAAVGAVARAAGVPYLVDACQSAGQLVLDVEAIGCDYLTGTSRKYLRGPRGIGFLYVRRSRLAELEPLMLDLNGATWTSRDAYTMRPDARRFEQWESDVAARLGFGAAVEYALALGMGRVEAAVRSLGRSLREALAAIKGVTVRDLGVEPCGIVTFTVAGAAPAAVKAALAAQAINVTTTTVAGTRLDMERRGLTDMVRASVHYYNTPAEIGALVEAVALFHKSSL